MAAAGAALWIPLKMLRVAHGDTTTALATLEASSKATVVTGMLVLLLPTVVLVAWAACLMSWASEFGRIAGAARDEHAAARDTAKRAAARAHRPSGSAGLGHRRRGRLAGSRRGRGAGRPDLVRAVPKGPTPRPARRPGAAAMA